MTSTLTDKAVVGRRITLTYYRDLPDGPKHPGIVTLVTSDKTGVLIRLDGKRYNIPARVDFEGITYLDQVVDVPALPMGRFTPAASDDDGFLEQDGVLLSTIREDGEDVIVITGPGRQEEAIAAASAYLDSAGVDISYVNFDAIRPYWAVFEWRAEDALSPWSVRWDNVAEGDDQAVHIYHLPA